MGHNKLNKHNNINKHILAYLTKQNKTLILITNKILITKQRK